MKLLCTLLSVAFLASEAHAQVKADYWANRHPIRYSMISSGYAVIIGVAEGQSTSEKRSASGVSTATTFTVENVKVLSSSDGENLGEVKVLVPNVVPYEDLIPLPKGKIVLLLATRSESGQLTFPLPTGNRLDLELIYPAKSQNEYLGLAFFETKQSALVKYSNKSKEFALALAAACEGASDENLQRIIEYITTVPPPDVDKNGLAFGHPSNWYSDVLESAVSKESSYHKAQIYYALNYHRYYGFADKYLRAVRDSSPDPKAFPGGVGWPCFIEDDRSDPKLKGWFHHDAFDAEAVVKSITSSKNQAVTLFQLKTLGKPLTQDQEQRLLPLLDSPSPEVVWAFANRLALWHNDLDHAPADPIKPEQTSLTNEKTYPDLDKIVRYWKKKTKAN